MFTLRCDHYDLIKKIEKSPNQKKAFLDVSTSNSFCIQISDQVDANLPMKKKCA